MRIAETFSIRLVPEFLVGYVRTDSSMSVNGELMEASFSVVLQRARQRNPNLPPAIFRRSARNFYLYLAGWVHHSWSCTYMIKAMCKKPHLAAKNRDDQDIYWASAKGNSGDPQAGPTIV
jgi:hypothetical protein